MTGSIRERAIRSITRSLTTERHCVIETSRHSDGTLWLEIRDSLGQRIILCPSDVGDLYELLKLGLDKADE